MSGITDAWAERTESPVWNTTLAATKLLAGAGFSYWGITQKFPKLGAVAGVALSYLEAPSLINRNGKIESAHKDDLIGRAGVLPLIRGIQLGTLASLATFFVRAVPGDAWKVVGGVVVGAGVVAGSLYPIAQGIESAKDGGLPTAGYALRLWTKRDQKNPLGNRSLNGPIGVLTGRTEFSLYNALWAATKLTTGAILTWVAASRYPAIGITAGALLSLIAEHVASQGTSSDNFLRKPEQNSKIAQAGLLPFIRGIQLATTAALLKVIVTTIPPGAWKVTGCTVGLLAAAPLVVGVLCRSPERSDWEQTGIFFRIWSPKEKWHKSALIISAAKLALGGCLTWVGIQKFPGLGTTAGVIVSLSEMADAAALEATAANWQDKGNQKLWLGQLGFLPFIRGVQLATTAYLLKTIALTVPVGAWKVLGTLVGPAVAAVFTATAFNAINKKPKAAGVALRVWYPKAESRKSLCCLETLKLIGSTALGYWAIKRYPAIGLGLSVFLSGAELAVCCSDSPTPHFDQAHKSSILGAIGGLSLIRGLQLATLAHLPLTLYREMPLGFWMASGSVVAAVFPALFVGLAADRVLGEKSPRKYSTPEKLGVALRVWNSSSHDWIAPGEE